jgi:hypothetical protein
MRKTDRAFVVAGLMSLSILVAVSSCDESADATVKTVEAKPNRKLIENTLQTSQWNATYFYNDQDVSSELIGYTFIFQGDGSLQVIRNDESITGVWSSYQSTQDQLKLNLEFNADQGSFRDLTQDWVVVHQSDQIIKLRHKSNAKDIQPAELTLERV